MASALPIPLSNPPPLPFNLSMDALAFLERSAKAKPLPIYVLAGDEPFLQRLALDALKKSLLGEGEDAFGLSSYGGDKAEYATVRSDLETLPFLSPRRVVVVSDADPFVTKYRSSLERYFAKPAEKGVLVLEVKTWPSTTKLAKALTDVATIQCKAPPAYKLPQWCVQWCQARHGKPLSQPAAQLLVDLIGPEMGQLDQELEKLSIYVDQRPKIDVADVDVLVGRSQAANVFKILDAIAAGRPAEALKILSRLFEQGDDALKILGALGFQLRKLANAARLSRQGVPVSAALDRVGVPPFARQGAEAQLRHLGRRRADRLFDWLLEVDLGVKGSSPLPPHILLERLLVRLGRKAEPLSRS